MQKKEEHDSLCLSCGAGENADDGGDGSDSSFGVLLVTAMLSFLMQQSQGMEALQMLIGGFVIFMIPQVVGSVIVLLELAAVMLRQAWYI